MTKYESGQALERMALAQAKPIKILGPKAVQLRVTCPRCLERIARRRAA